GSGSLTLAAGQLSSGIGDAIGQIFKFDTVTVSVNNFVFNYGGTTSVSGTVSVSVTNAVLFPSVSFINKSLGNLSGTYTFHSPAVLSLTIPAFDLPIGDAVVLHLGATTIQPGQATMASVSNVS